MRALQEIGIFAREPGSSARRPHDYMDLVGRATQDAKAGFYTPVNEESWPREAQRVFEHGTNDAPE